MARCSSVSIAFQSSLGSERVLEILSIICAEVRYDRTTQPMVCRSKSDDYRYVPRAAIAVETAVCIPSVNGINDS